MFRLVAMLAVLALLAPPAGAEPENAPEAPADQPAAGSPTVADGDTSPPQTPAPPAGGAEGEANPASDSGGTSPLGDPAAELPAGDEEEVIEIRASILPGSDHSLGAKDLERFENDDIHEILANVPGVYFREEDGFGLRPNIGMRGSNPERSAKIALMEDGILIAPAPYSAPAAYYFPLVTRMRAVEVVKGPGSVLYGPNTVGGSVNLRSNDVPAAGQTGFVDMAGGETLYGKLHGRYGFGSESFGMLIEGVRLQSEGFKELDGGGDTGFAKNDLLFKARLSTPSSADVYQALNLTLGYADETSNETYTGLTVADLEERPDRRYRATALDHMEWDHLRWQLAHRIEVGASFDVTTTLYRNSFERSWFKLNRFRGEPDLAGVLANPEAGNNAIFYSILRGEANTSSPAEELLIGENLRTFVSQGIQSVFHSERRAWPGKHDLIAGVRLHQDQADRVHTEDSFAMIGGDLMSTGAERVTNTDSLASAQALALFVQDKAQIGNLHLTVGSRVELVRNRFENRLMPEQDHSQTYNVWIPGVGAYYQWTPWLGVLAGAHRGFVPVAPNADTDVEPERSFNYEAGIRISKWGARAEAIGFFNDYQNLKGTCTVSSGCQNDLAGTEFNGGEVRTGGLETLIQAEPTVARLAGKALRLPLRVSYTLTDSEFQTSFSSSFPQWGDVMSGDSLPYIATHQLAARLGVASSAWQLNTQLRYQSQMRDVAGQGEIPPQERIPAFAVIDIAGSYDFGRWGRVYASADNILDNRYLVSLRPFGARPGKPRLVIIGYQNGF